MAKKGSQELKFRNAELIARSEPIQKLVNQLRNKWGIPPNGFQNIQEYKDWLYGLTSSVLNNKKCGPSQFSLFLSDLSCSFENEFPAYWTTFFFYLTTKGEIKKSFKLRSGRTINTPRIKMSQDGKKILLQITANTKREDVEFVWSDVKNIQKKMSDFDKTRQRKKLERDLLMLEGITQGKNALDSYVALGDKLPNDDSEYETAIKGLQRIKKRIKGQ